MYYLTPSSKAGGWQGGRHLCTATQQRLTYGKAKERRVALNAYRDSNVSHQNGSVISEVQKKLRVT